VELRNLNFKEGGWGGDVNCAFRRRR